jgi:hypothetical protein
MVEHTSAILMVVFHIHLVIVDVTENGNVLLKMQKTHVLEPAVVQ